MTQVKLVVFSEPHTNKKSIMRNLVLMYFILFGIYGSAHILYNDIMTLYTGDVMPSVDNICAG